MDEEPPVRLNWQQRAGSLALLGPAIVAGVAYLDPGNVATNLSAGAAFGSMLLWVIVLANLMAWLVQYLSAKLGLVTGKSLPELLGTRFRSRGARWAFWAQAEVVAIATDVAEVVGGAIALNLLFGLPLIIGGLITGAISMGLLSLHSRGVIRTFEVVILGLVLITGVGFIAALFVQPPSVGQILPGFLPRFSTGESVLLAAGIVGATIMPHAIYAHSALSRDRFAEFLHATSLGVLLRATKWDVSIAMLIAGAINLAILIVGATALGGAPIEATISAAHRALGNALGSSVATMFAIGLLASGLASSAVGTYAGGVIMQGLLRKKMRPIIMRAATLVPALIVIAVAPNATEVLVYSQVLLSFGLPFALFPLVRLTSDRKVMGSHASTVAVRAVGYAIAISVSALNLYLIWLSLSAN